VIAVIGDRTSRERDLNPEVPMIQTQVQSAQLQSDVSPLLRSIAVELRERTREVRDLETKQKVFESDGANHEKELADIVARLSIHRRELRMAQRELERLGWFVEDVLPLRLVRMDLNGLEEATWQVTDTGFYRAGNG
jgi:hypothetical protein